MTNRVGEHLGNYRLLRLLGRGGFATVYLGEHIYLKSLAELAAVSDVVEHTRTLEAYGLFFLARNREGDHEHGAACLHMHERHSIAWAS